MPDDNRAIHRRTDVVSCARWATARADHPSRVEQAGGSEAPAPFRSTVARWSRYLGRGAVRGGTDRCPAPRCTSPRRSSPAEFKYRAFLSYAHVDTAWGKRLHRQLEVFRIDKDLAGRETPCGPVPKTLRPIFRDREDFTGGHSLTDATIAALDASAALIVLCSPVAATRPAVNEEVRLFRSRHRTGR